MRVVHQHVQVGRRLLIRVALKIAQAAHEVVIGCHLSPGKNFSVVLCILSALSPVQGYSYRSRTNHRVSAMTF